MLNPFLHHFLRCIKTSLAYLKENIGTYGNYTLLHVNSKQTRATNNRRDPKFSTAFPITKATTGTTFRAAFIKL